VTLIDEKGPVDGVVRPGIAADASNCIRW